MADQEKYIQFLLAPDKVDPVRPGTHFPVKTSIVSSAATFMPDSSKETIYYVNFCAGSY